MSCLFSPLMAAVVWSTAPTLFTLLHGLLDNQERVGAHFQGRMAGVPISCLFSFSDWGSVVVGVSWTRTTHRFLLLCLSYKWPWPKNQGKLECAFIQKLNNTACCWHQEEDLVSAKMIQSLQVFILMVCLKELATYLHLNYVSNHLLFQSI